jgi:hypothetical protein
VKRPRKLTKSQQATIDAEREANFAAFEAFKARFDGVVFKAEVLYWSGSEGLVRGLNGEGKYWLFACNIRGAKTWYPETACVSHAEGQIIDAELKVFYGSGALIVSHTQGTLDADRWNALDQSRLAFRTDDDGNLVSGLFA